MTKKASKSQLMDSGLNTKADKKGNPFIDKAEV